MVKILIDGDKATIDKEDYLPEVVLGVAQGAVSLTPAVKAANNYLDWFAQEMRQASPSQLDDLMNAVAIHTGNWGQAQRIVTELENLGSMFDSHRHYGKDAKEAHRRQKYLVLSVFLAELLRAGFKPNEAS